MMETKTMTVQELYEHQQRTGNLWPYGVGWGTVRVESIYLDTEGYVMVCEDHSVRTFFAPEWAINVDLMPGYAELQRLQAENTRLRQALEAIERNCPKDEPVDDFAMVAVHLSQAQASWVNGNIARAALADTSKGE